MKVLGLFKTQYSLGKSVLTLAAPDKLDENYPVSIFDIAKKHDLKQVIVVDDSISGFLEAHQNAKKASVKLVYGLQMRCIEDIANKSEASLKTLSKVIIFIKNNQGYKDLVKISSVACKEGFYYKPNIDFANLKKYWTPNLKLVVPFYDSFLFKNCLEGGLCVPNFSFTKPSFFIENSGLPFDALMQKKVRDYATSIQAPVLPARTICYYKNDDFAAYLTLRCINERTSLEKPQLDHLASNWFSFERWQQQESKPEVVNL